MLNPFTITRSELNQVNWKAIVVFYGLACAISYCLNVLPNLNRGMLPVHSIFTYGLGPILAACITRIVFPDVPRSETIAGSSPWRTGLFVGLPLLLSTVLGIHNRSGQNEHLYSLLVAVSGILYGFVEEAGWRGFLTNALRPLPKVWRVVLIGVLWCTWHFTFLPDVSTAVGPGKPLIMVYGLFVLASWGLDAAAKTTKSVLVAACLHETFNLTGSLPTTAVLMVVWTALLWTWNKPADWAGATQLFPRTFRYLPILVSVGLFLVPGSPAAAQPDSTYGTVPREEIKLGGADFGLFDETFYQNQLFLLGESHGVQQPQDVDFALLKHLNERIGVRYYIAEVDAVKAYYLNEYLLTGDEATLMKVFRSWIAERAQWANRDFVRKIQKIRALNQTLPESRRIRFVGIDRIGDKPLTADYLAGLLHGRKLSRPVRSLADSLLNGLRAGWPDSVVANVALTWLRAHPTDEQAYRRRFGPRADELRHLLTNISYLKTIRSREAVLFANFKTVLPTLNGEKLYGLWGYFHVLQQPPLTSGKPFACRVRESDLYLRDKVVSITFSYLDCYTMLPTRYLPPFWQDKGKAFTRIDKFNNDSELMRTEGMDVLRAVTRPNSLTLFALDRAGSFARRTPIRITYAPFMPANQRMQFDPARPMTDYFQYLILVRNSDMTEPLVP